MGIWDIINYVNDRVKGITPDMSVVKRAGDAAYQFSLPSITNVNQVVVDGFQKMPQYRPDDETIAKINLFSKILAKNAGSYAVKEGYKHVPGGTVASKLILDSWREVEQKNHKDNMKLISGNAVEGTSKK